MKVGKESIAGAMAALEAWEQRDHAAVRARETRSSRALARRACRAAGRQTRASCPIPPTIRSTGSSSRSIRPRAGTTAWALAAALAAGDPPVIVRDHEVEHGHFYLDPCNLHPGEAEIVADRILAELAAGAGERPARRANAAERRVRRFERLLRWPD